MASTEQYSSCYVEEILDEVRKMMSDAPVPPSLAIKSAIRNMLDMVRAEPQGAPATPPAAAKQQQEPCSPAGDDVAALASSLQSEESMSTFVNTTSSSSSATLQKTLSRLKKSDFAASGSGAASAGADHWSVTAQCVVCGLDGVKGKFCKRGYKCERCEGGLSLDRANPQPPYGSDPLTVPSTSYIRDFCFKDSRASLLDSTESGMRRQRSVALPDELQTPLVKYKVLQTAHVDDACRQTMEVLRTLVHPNIAYCYGSWEDKKRGKCWTLLEQAPTLAEFHPSFADADTLTSSLSFDGLPSPLRWGRTAAAAAAAQQQPADEGHAAERAMQRLEWVKTVLVSLMQALQALKQTGLPHGDLRPENIAVDSHHVVKLRVVPCPAATADGVPRPRLPAPYCPPEDEVAAPGAAYTPSFAGDMFTLGVTLAIIAFGPERRPPASEAPSVGESSLLQLVEGMTAPRPEARLTLQNAFLHPLLASVRVVNGVPVETTLTVIHGTTAGAELHSSGACFAATAEGAAGPMGMLQKFLAESGPAFQVVSTSTSCTLYSVKTDPRRRRGKSAISESSPLKK